MLACFFVQELEISLLNLTGSGNSNKIINFTNYSWSKGTIQSLPSLQAIRECDAVNAFHGFWNGPWLSKVQKKKEYLDAIGLLWENLEIYGVVFMTTKRLICYATECDESYVNLVRYKKSFQDKIPDWQQLPTTENELQQHVKCCYYQLNLWKKL